MGLLNLLLGSDKAPPVATRGPNGAPVDPNAPTNLSGVTAEAPPIANAPKGKPGAGYNNVEEVNALNAVKGQYPKGNTGSGLGLSNLIGAHGTLRDVLGTLGDAFLIQSGNKPIHAEQRYREQMANAAAGFENDPGGAASRLAASGAPGSLEAAQTMYNTKVKQDETKATREDTNAYRESQQAATKDWRDAQSQDKNNQRLQRLLPYAGAIVNSPEVKTKEDYQKAYTRAVSMAKRIDPNAEGYDIGLIAPEDWQPGEGTTTGMTQGQNTRNQTTIRGQNVTAGSAAARTAATVRGQNVGAANNAARIKATERGQDLTNSRAGKAGSLVIPGLTVGSGGGAKPTPTAADRAYLKAHPEKAAAFKAHFGTP